MFTVLINGESVVVDEINEMGYDGFLFVLEDEREYYVFNDEFDAGSSAREYFEDLAISDPEELIYLLGKDSVIMWLLGQEDKSYGFSSFEEWLQDKEENPADHWAVFDGRTEQIELPKNLADELDIDEEVVAYRVV